jgi:hypothetical protein
MEHLNVYQIVRRNTVSTVSESLAKGENNSFDCNIDDSLKFINLITVLWFV